MVDLNSLERSVTGGRCGKKIRNYGICMCCGSNLGSQDKERKCDGCHTKELLEMVDYKLKPENSKPMGVHREF